MKIIQHPSLNYESRAGAKVDTLNLHNTTAPLESALAKLTGQVKPRTSAHYVVDRVGAVYQLVAEENAAWHAGGPRLNRRSIGVEIVAWDESADLRAALGMTEVQEAALVELCRAIIARHGITVARILPHRKVTATACPNLVWPNDGGFAAWVQKNLAPPVAAQPK